MKVRRVSADCQGGNCPTVYLSDRGTVVFQGYTVASAEGMTLAEGEQAVELPLDVVRSAMPELGRA